MMSRIDKLEMFDDYMKAIDQFYDRIMEKERIRRLCHGNRIFRTE